MAAKKMKDEDLELLSYEELAERTKLKPSFIRKAKEKYGLPFHKIGRSVRFSVDDFLTWREQHRHVSNS